MSKSKKIKELEKRLENLQLQYDCLNTYAFYSVNKKIANDKWILEMINLQGPSYHKELIESLKAQQDEIK